MAPELEALDRALRGRTTPLRIWWRDDDAGRDDARLARLLELACGIAAPVTLAVVPAWLENAAAERILAAPLVTVAQHGWSHTDHAAPGERPVELGGVADRMRLTDELRRGRRLLGEAFAARFLPVMVPPWNRIAADVGERLAGLGYGAVSTIARADGAPPPPQRLPRVDVHLDLVDWPTRRALELGPAAARLAAVAQRAPCIGLMTHHLVTDEDGFGALRRLLSALRNHPAVEFRALADLLPAGVTA